MADPHPFALRVETEMAADELTSRLKKLEPWAHRIEFSNGVTTAALARRRVFSDAPLRKLHRIDDVVPLRTLDSALDVGCNSGYNSIHLARAHGMRVVGIDIAPRHVEAARFIALLAGVRATFEVADAERYVPTEQVDLVVHFGTLYHLPNPLLALRTAAASLVPGGWLALETQLYDHPDDPNICYWMHLRNDDPTNHWALSRKALIDALRLSGFSEAVECSRSSPERLGKHMSRAVFVAQRAT